MPGVSPAPHHRSSDKLWQSSFNTGHQLPSNIFTSSNIILPNQINHRQDPAAAPCPPAQLGS